VELAAGTFSLAGTLEMHHSGVVLRGAGAKGAKATVLQMKGTPHLAIQISGEWNQQTVGGATSLKDRYLPAGATVIHLANASNIHARDTIQIVKPVTPQWTHFMGMDHLSRDGQPQTWLKNDIRIRRRVASVAGDAVRLEVPLTDSFDSQFYPGVKPAVTRIVVTGEIAETGVESLQISAPARTIAYREDPEFDGIAMNRVADAWLRDLSFQDTTNSVRIDHNAERLTVVNVDIMQSEAVTSHAQPFDFRVNGSQILIDRCTATGDRVFYVATQSESEGPVVVLHCRFMGGGAIEGHQRWSTGLLIDSCAVPEGRINLRNRGEMGSGHGWAIGWSVLWNNQANTFVVQNPPGAINWSIGDIGEHDRAPMPVFDAPAWPVLPSGVVESENTHVKPDSLYLEQLRERKGEAAVRAIGYR
jgi:hypothetical protein